MEGFGSYNNWEYYASHPSSLSAFAPPFSVNRSTLPDVSAPFVDSAAEPSVDAVPVAPIQFQSSYGYDFFANPVRELDSSKPHGFSGFQGLDSYRVHLPPLDLPSKDTFSYDHCTDCTKSSIAEAQPYYPSYVSGAIHDHSSLVAPNHWSLSSGFPSLEGLSLGSYADKSPELGLSDQSAVSWNQFPDLNSHGKGKQVGVGSGFSSKQTNAIGSVAEERMNQGYQDVKESNNGEVLHVIDWEKHNVPASANQLDDKSGWWRTIKPMPAEFLGTSIMQPPPMSSETHHEAPLKLVADSGNHHLSYTGSYDKCMRHGDKPSRVDTVPSITRTGLVTDLNIGNNLEDGDVGHNNLYNRKEAYHMSSPGSAGCFDLGHLRMHLERNEPSSSNNMMISDKNVLRDVADYMTKGRHGFQNPNPHAIKDNLSLRLIPVEDVNSAEKSFESGDRCNLAVDSPCWKGASTAHFSHYQSSEALPPEYVQKNDECFGSVIQEPLYVLLDTENNVTQSHENSNSYPMHTEIVCQETSSVYSPKKFSVTQVASECCKSDGAVNSGSFQSVPSHDYGLQYMDTEMKENSVPPAKPTDCESGSSHMEHQVVDENKLMSQKQHISCIGDACAECNVNKCLEFGTPHTAEHALSSSSSVVDMTTPLEESAGKVATQKLNVQMLVDTMQNLSELLLYHCSNDACELKERDCVVLKNVISNLNTCALKNVEQISPAQECLFDKPETSRCVGGSSELQKNESFKRPQLTKIGPDRSMVEFENPLVAEANLQFRSGKSHLKLSDSISRKDDVEVTNANNMTQALKMILSENFHDDEGVEPQTVLYKNLWLEAEAALCSIYYRARYNQMRIEMNKHSYKERAVDTEEQLKPGVVPTLRQIRSSSTKVCNHPKPDFSVQDLPVLDPTKVNDPSCVKFSTDMNEPNAVTPGGKDAVTPGGKDAVTPGGKDAVTPGGKDAVAPGGKGGQDLDSFIQNYAVSNTDKEARRNDEASVMARYHVIKGGQDLDSFIQNYAVSNTDKEARRNEEASVMARYHVLKARIDKSCIDTTNLEERSDMVNKSAPRGGDNPNQVNFGQNSPIPEENKDDYEASVVARFHILKSWVEGSSSSSSEEKLSDGVGKAGKGMNDPTIAENATEGKSLNVHVNPIMVHINSYTAVDKPMSKDFHLDLEDNEEIQSYGTCEFQLPTFYSDSLASDWEHVEKKNL